jgi:RNA polymerase sigma-70 factor (ECF subfamily)
MHVQDAYAQALSTWATDGIPDRPGAWLTTVARNRALDALRAREVLRGRCRCWSRRTPAAEAGPIPDDRLRLIFTCCHPALARRRRSR